MTVAVENMFPVRVGGREMTFHANQDLEELDGLPDLVLDTSHAAVAEHDLVEVRRRFDDRIRHVHLSDNAGKGWDSHLPPGEGVLPLGAFLDDLSSSDYAGAITLEVDLRRQLTDDDRAADDHGVDARGRGAPAGRTGPPARSRLAAAASLHDVRRPTFIILIVLFAAPDRGRHRAVRDRVGRQPAARGPHEPGAAPEPVAQPVALTPARVTRAPRSCPWTSPSVSAALPRLTTSAS